LAPLYISLIPFFYDFYYVRLTYLVKAVTVEVWEGITTATYLLTYLLTIRTTWLFYKVGCTGKVTD